MAMGRDYQSQGFFPSNFSPKAENPGNVPQIFIQVPIVSAICVAWDDFGTAKTRPWKSEWVP